MPTKDIIHDIVKTALIKDGWTITHDPFPIRFGNLRVLADLGAEQPIAAMKEGRRIAVEITSFVGLSLMDDLEKAIGQYGLYSALLSETEPEREVYLAVSEAVFANLLDTVGGWVVIKKLSLKIMYLLTD